MKITGRAELGAIGNQGGAARHPSPLASFLHAQKAPALLPAAGVETPSAMDRTGNVPEACEHGQGDRSGLWTMQLHLAMVRK